MRNCKAENPANNGTAFKRLAKIFSSNGKNGAKKGMPFRSAYKLVGQIVRYCIENNKVLEDMSIEEYRNFSPVFDEELYEDISLEACVAKRCSTGGTAPSSLERQIGYIQNLLGFSAAE